MDWPILTSVHIDWSILISVHMHADGESPNIQCTMRHQIFSHQAMGASGYQFTIIHFLSDGESSKIQLTARNQIFSHQAVGAAYGLNKIFSVGMPQWDHAQTIIHKWQRTSRYKWCSRQNLVYGIPTVRPWSDYNSQMTKHQLDTNNESDILALNKPTLKANIGKCMSLQDLFVGFTQKDHDQTIKQTTCIHWPNLYANVLSKAKNLIGIAMQPPTDINR